MVNPTILSQNVTIIAPSQSFQSCTVAIVTTVAQLQLSDSYHMVATVYDQKVARISWENHEGQTNLEWYTCGHFTFSSRPHRPMAYTCSNRK